MTEAFEQQTRLKLTIEVIKKFKYSKTEAVDANGKKAYPKDIRWDSTTPGFGVRIFPTGTKSYIYKYRNEKNEQKFLTIGDTGEISLDHARKAAKRRATDVIDGADPARDRHDARHGKLMSELCRQFIVDYVIAEGHTKKTLEENERRIKLQILPALGKKQVQHITDADIMALRNEIGIKQGKQPLANKVRRQLSTMFDLAIKWKDYVPDNFVNPAKSIKDFKERERELYVYPEHMSVLAQAIEREPNEIAKLAIWMFLLTGKRKMEILSAQWDNIDEAARTLYIPTTKNGEQEQLPLNDEAWAIIERAKEYRKSSGVVGNPYVFPGSMPNQHLVNIHKPWSRIRKDAIDKGAHSLKRDTKQPDGTIKTEYVVIHGLRHTAAVWLVNHADADTALVGKILNHKSSLATKRYAKFKIRTKERALQDLGSMITEASKILPKGEVVKFAR